MARAAHPQTLGRPEKCAFVYALLSASQRGRELARRVFRSDLLDDVDLYRPWLDARFRPPLACIGGRREVWDAFEVLAEKDQDKPVIRQWLKSALRQRAYSGSDERPNHRRGTPDGLLSRLVRRAAKLVQRWLDGKPSHGPSLWR